MDNHGFVTSLGFADVKINGTTHKDLEVVWKGYSGEIFENCPEGFVPASASIMKAVSNNDVPCRIGVEHDADKNAMELTPEQASNTTFVIDKMKELDYHWNLDGKRVETFHAEKVDMSSATRGNIQALKLAYYIIYDFGHLKATVDNNNESPICCMRHPYHSAPRTPSYPQYPNIGLGLHNVTIHGHEFKNVPYIAVTNNGYCPDGMQKAIITDKESFVFGISMACSVSVAFVGSPTPLSVEDRNDLKVKRNRYQFIIDGKLAGVIPDELWMEGEPHESLEKLQNKSVLFAGQRGLFTPYDGIDLPPPCCMDLAQAKTD